MRRAGLLLPLALLLAACGRRPALPEEDLLVQVTVGAREVELGRAFPVTVVRVWSKDLVPADWEDDALSPLVVRLEETTRREDERRVEETRRYRAYAFTLRDVTVPALRLAARPTGGGEKLVAEAPPVRLLVRRALDPDEPGAPELPGEPLAEPAASWTWALLLAVAAALAGVVAVRRRRRPPPLPLAAPPPPSSTPQERALRRLREIRGRAPRDAAAVLQDVLASCALLRGYVAERFGVRAWQKTTPELLAAPEVREVATPPQQDVLGSALALCDRVKFAAHAPAAAERRDVLDAAEAFVRETGSDAS